MTKRTDKITLIRLRTLVEAYGANPGRWPTDERKAAKSLLANNPRAGNLVQQAGLIDAFLDAAPEPAKAGTAFKKRLATIPFQDSAAINGVQTTFGEFLKGLFPARGFAPQGMALALAGILGIWLGVTADMAPEAQAIQLDAGSYLIDNPDLHKDLREFQ